MHLKKLEIFGFKSFADKIEIHFDKGITGIVGPNGSGKSNIGDAVRWVLGEQSAKNLRGAHMEDIIFNGTEKRKSLAWCEVSLTLDNADHALPVDYAEVTIMRRVYRSGDSEYFINRTACRLKDIVDLFRDSGIGREGYSIIGQGKVDEILSTRSEDRRNVFQEAAGISKFRVRKEESERSLEHTRQNMVRLADTMEEMERQLEPLRVQSENARQFLTLSAQLKDLELNRFLVMVERYEQQVSKLQAQVEDMHQQEEQQEGIISQEENGITAQSLEIDAMDAEISSMQAQILGLSDRMHERQNQLQLLRERMVHIRQDNERLNSEADADTSRSSSLIEEADALQATLEDRRQDRRGNEDEVRTQEENLALMDAMLAQEEQRLETMKTSVIESLGKLSDVKSAMARLSTLEQGMQTRSADIDQQLLGVQRDDDIALDIAGDIERGIAAVEEQRTSSIRELNDVTMRRQAMQTKAVQSDREIVSTREKLQASKTRISMLQSMKRDYEGFNATIKRLLTDARTMPELKRHIDNVVAEILDVPRDYVVAVEMALGNSLQDIITEQEEDAKVVIEYLKEKQYGRATFLPISTIRARYLGDAEKRLLTMPGCLGAASDLVGCDDKYRNIIGNLLGRTVIAKDMNTAIAMGRACGQSVRIVTLDGEILNPGGSITGGSVRSRFTSILSREVELEEAESAQEALAGTLAKLQAERETMRRELESMEETIKTLSAAVHEGDVALARERERLDKAGQSRKRSELARQTLQQEKERLIENLSDLRDEMQSIESQQGSIEQIGSTTRQDMAKLQVHINELREDRDALMERLGNLRMALAAGQKEREGLRIQIARLREEAARLMETARVKRDTIVQNTERMAAEEASVQEDTDPTQCKADLEAAQEKMLQAEQLRTSLRNAMMESEKALRQLQQDAMQRSGKIHGTELQLARVQGEREALQERMWDHYELTVAGAEAYRRADFQQNAAEKEIDLLRAQIRAMGTVNVNAVEDYLSLKTRHDEYLRQRNDLDKAEKDLLGVIDDLSARMEKQFKENFAKLNDYFGEIFQQLFGGGTARLVLQDEHDVLNCGIEIVAQPPGKRLQLLSLLSGGERALTATAILFAILRLRPSPFCILDEIEAALDEANLQHFAKFLQEYARSTQFVVVTHRKATMEASDMLYGVTMEEKGISRLVSVRMTDLVKENNHG